MAAPTSISDLINKTTGGSSGTPELIWAHIGRHTTAGAVQSINFAGALLSTWTFVNTPMGIGAAPGGTARNPGRTTVGALGQTDPSGGRKKWLVGIHGTCCLAAAGGLIFLADRLADFSGLSGTSTSLQNTTSLAVSRYTGTEAIGNQIYVEIYTSVGSTARTLTVNYTNENGASKSTTVQLGGSANFRSSPLLRHVPMATGDRGVRSVESVQLDNSTGTTGNFGITIARPLTCVSVGVSGAGGAPADILTNFGGPIEIKTDAALFFFGSFPSTTATWYDVGLQFVES
jgi:hypothetical protein